ncbi:MAG: 3TM-type holin [bacterium]
MPWFEDVIKQGVGALINSVGGLAKDVRTAVTGTAPLTEEMRIKLIEQVTQLETMANQMDREILQGQVELNKLEEQSGSFFRSGWRPFVGWVCGVGLCYEYLLQPFLAWGSLIWKIPVPPQLDMATLMPLLLGMLGIATMRTVEKIKGMA